MAVASVVAVVAGGVDDEAGKRQGGKRQGWEVENLCWSRFCRHVFADKSDTAKPDQFHQAQQSAVLARRAWWLVLNKSATQRASRVMNLAP